MYDIQPPRPSGRGSFWLLVHRRSGLLAASITLLVGAAAVTVALVAPAPAAVPAPVIGAPAGGVAPAARDQPRAEVRDEASGVSYALPDGWTEMQGDDFLFSISSGAGFHPPEGGSAMLAVGALDASVFASAAPALPDAARRLSSDFGEFFVPVPGRRADRVDVAATVDGRPAWTSGYRVVPTDAGADGADVRVTVIEDGGRRLYLVVVVSPADPALLAEAEAAAASLRFG